MVRPAADPLAALLELPGVPDAVAEARHAVDEVHRHPANRRGWPSTAAEASVRAARASAALAGGGAEIPAEGAVADPVLAGSLRVAQALGEMLGTWQRAPLQALARLHVLAAADLAEQDSVGRPSGSAETSARLDLLAQLVTGGTEVPAPVLVAVVHGELLALSPFGTADGVVARAAARLTAIVSGLDPKGLAVPEVAHLRRQTEYRRLAAGFGRGGAENLSAWLQHCCAALVSGCTEAGSIAESLAS